jgi:hypothetical protein
VDCERADAIEARVVAGGVGEWHGVAGREDSVADGGGVRGDCWRSERRGADEQDDGRSDDDDGRSDDDDGGDADNDNGPRCAVYIYGVYI